MATFKFKDKRSEEHAQKPIDHLASMGARCVLQTDVRKDLRIEAWYTRSGRSYIITIHDNGGWEAYAPVDDTNNIDATLAKIV